MNELERLMENVTNVGIMAAIAPDETHTPHCALLVL